MKNVVKFHESNCILGYNLDEKKRHYGKHLFDLRAFSHSHGEYTRRWWFIPMVDGLNDWFYDDKTTIISPINWTIDREELHIDNGIKGCIKVKGEFVLKFENIKRHKTKKYEVEIVIDNHVMNSHTCYGMEFKDCGRSFISIKGTSRVGYGRYDGSKIYFTSTEGLFNAAELNVDGDLYIHKDLRRKECLYINHIGGFIGNKQITDEIYDKFIEVCNMMAIDAKENFKKLETKFHALEKGV
jgi:hypothetical protein